MFPVRILGVHERIKGDSSVLKEKEGDLGWLGGEGGGAGQGLIQGFSFLTYIACLITLSISLVWAK